ncbi:MAG: YqgE/AlgH family protein [Pseudomonadota bacterium]|nr:YqgE/AlgH family protein [Pseudomonadota bacterium]|tara:strand:- start:687 stop:1274 length:588 start_codon:yes stop_codon:yes gene_type:complete
MSNNFKKKVSKSSFLTGKILIASPSMLDPRFDKSVIYICEHSLNGAMGIIINQPIKEIQLNEIFSQMNIKSIGKNFNRDVYFGGPVETTRGFILHSSDYQMPETIHLDNEVSLSSSTEILQSIAKGKGPENYFMAFGYAGWSSGQLDEEIKDNSWLHTEADNKMLWHYENKEKWNKALYKIGIKPGSLINESGRA